jgi:hypothetical protein
MRRATPAGPSRAEPCQPRLGCRASGYARRYGGLRFRNRLDVFHDRVSVSVERANPL